MKNYEKEDLTIEEIRGMYNDNDYETERLKDDVIVAIQNEYGYSEELAKSIYFVGENQGHFYGLHETLNYIEDALNLLEEVRSLLKECDK